MVDPSKGWKEIYDRLIEKMHEYHGRIAAPDTPEEMITLVREIARATEHIVNTQEFEELVHYWYTHGNMSPFDLLSAPVDLISAHNFLHYLAFKNVLTIEQLREEITVFKQENAKELQAWHEIQSAKESLERACKFLGIDRSELYVAGAPVGVNMLTIPDPEMEKMYRQSWEARVDNALLTDRLYQEATAGSDHAATNFASWATRYLFCNTSIDCKHISDRSIFPKPWKLLEAILAECFVARSTSAIRTTVEQYCAKNRE